MIDLEKISKSRLVLKGICNNSKRLEMVEMAIKSITEKNNPWIKTYWGFKNYAGFGDQDISGTSYGYGPKHGSVVFSIGLNQKSQNLDNLSLGENEIYHLLCFRDFKGFRVSGDNKYNTLSLSALLYQYNETKKKLEELKYGLDYPVDIESKEIA